MSDFYFTFDLHGPSRLPRREDVERCIRDHRCALALQLDANVCLDIAAFVTGRAKQQAHIKSCVRSLLRCIELSGCEVIPAIGLMELGMKQGTLSLDQGRYDRLAKVVWEGLHLNLSAIEAEHYLPTGLPSPPNYTPPAGAEVLGIFFEFAYCAFLKVHLIARGGLSADKARDNVAEFLRWADEELNMSLPFVIQFALALFGGDTKVRKMLKIDSSTASPRATAWGAAQDMFSLYAFQQAHLGTVANSTRVLYVTRDTALFEMRKRLDFRALIVDGSAPLLGVNQIDYDFPHYTGCTEAIESLLKDFRSRRLLHVTDALPPSPRLLIDRLEKELDSE